MKFTYFGQSCFLLELGNHKLLFDPFITGNELASHINIEEIKADFILVSHAHDDHTHDLVSLAKQTGAQVIANWEIYSCLLKQGVDNVHPMNFGTFDFPFGTLTMMQAMHSSSFADGTYGGAAGGFIIASQHGNVYYSGDTSLFLDMQLVPFYAQLDCAILPIGGNFTMNVPQAIKASEFIQCNKVVGVHFDTFGYIKIDHQAAIDSFKQAGKTLILPQIGGTIDLK